MFLNFRPTDITPENTESKGITASPPFRLDFDRSARLLFESTHPAETRSRGNCSRPETTAPLTCYAFEEFELDTELYELRRHGGAIPVQPPLLDALVYLIDHRDRTVTKEELIERVWNEDALSDAAFSSRLTSVREAVDDGPDQRVIETIEGEGVRFVAEVGERSATSPGGQTRGLRRIDDHLATARDLLQRWSPSELEWELTRARELAEAEADRTRLATVLCWLATLHEHRGEHRRSQELMEESLSLFDLSDHPVPERGQPCPGETVSAAGSAALESIELLTSSVFHQGRFEKALRLAEQGLEIESQPCPSLLTATLGKDPKAACHGWAALALWFLGRADQAAGQAEAALALAKEPDHAHGLPFVLAQVTVLHQLRREPDAVRRWTKTPTTSASGQALPHRLAITTILDGWARVFQSERAREIARGLARIETGLETYRRAGTTIGLAYLLGVHADALQRAGKLEEALVQIGTARKSKPSRGRSSFWHAELDRLEGCIYLEQGDGQKGETSLQHARALARRQGALTIELRTACCQARLLDSRGDTRGARRLLSEVYGRFEEGHRTPDLREAAALLETL